MRTWPLVVIQVYIPLFIYEARSWSSISFCYIFAVGRNVDMNISTGNSSHRTLARLRTLGCPVSTRQDILPNFMYELDKKLVLESMFVPLLYFSSQGMPTGDPLIMSIAGSHS
jgi:hypothetical protein